MRAGFSFAQKARRSFEIERRGERGTLRGTPRNVLSSSVDDSRTVLRLTRVSVRVFSRALRLLPCVAALLACACGGMTTVSAGALPQAASSRAFPNSGISKISHVVIVLQENRSFDNLFQGFPGADVQSYGYTSSGKQLTLQPVSLAAPWDLGHNSLSYFQACDGRVVFRARTARWTDSTRGQNLRHARRTDVPHQYPQYGYVPQSETKPYFAMASQYVLGRPHVHLALRRQLRVASVHHRRAGGVDGELPQTTWGCDGGPKDRLRPSRSNAVRPAPSGVFRLSDARRRTRRGRLDVALLHLQPRRRER